MEEAPDAADLTLVWVGALASHCRIALQRTSNILQLFCNEPLLLAYLGVM